MSKNLEIKIGRFDFVREDMDDEDCSPTLTKADAEAIDFAIEDVRGAIDDVARLAEKMELHFGRIDFEAMLECMADAVENVQCDLSKRLDKEHAMWQV